MDLEITDNIVFEDKLLARCILEGATYLFENCILCDIELVIEGQKINAHRSILAAASLYFRGMFCAGLKETGQQEITIYDVDYIAMKNVITFFYTSSITLTEDNIFDVINVVDLLGVASLHSACNEFLHRFLTVRNCVSVYIICQMHGYLDVAQEATRLACKNFSHLMEIDEFLDMPVEMLLACIDSKILNVCGENALLTRICAWVKHSIEERGKYLQSLLDQINVYVIDLAKAESTLYQLPTLEAKAFKWLERARHLRERGISITSRNKQRFNLEKKVVLSCGGIPITGGPIANVEALTVGDSSWRCMIPAASQLHGFRVMPPMKRARFYIAATLSDSHVYIIGGRCDNGPLASIERYSVDANEWEDHVSLPEPLEGAAAAMINGSIYVTGGFNNTSGITNKVWVLDRGHTSWRALPPMSHRRSHHGLLAVNGYLYAIAGAGADGEVQASMERMSTQTLQWQPLSPLQEPRSHFGFVRYNCSLYIIGGLNPDKGPLRSVQVYDTLMHEWASDTPLSVGRHSHGATVAERRIYIAGGTDGIHQLATCDVFNPNTHQWHCQPSLARTRLGQAMASITVPVNPPPKI